MYRTSHDGTGARIGNVYVYWSGYPPRLGPEKEKIERIVADVAAAHNFNLANIICGTHDRNRANRSQYAPEIPCEEHITAKFVNGDRQDMFFHSVTAHIYTSNGNYTAGNYEIFRPEGPRRPVQQNFVPWQVPNSTATGHQAERVAESNPTEGGIATSLASPQSSTNPTSPTFSTVSTITTISPLSTFSTVSISQTSQAGSRSSTEHAHWDSYVQTPLPNRMQQW